MGPCSSLSPKIDLAAVNPEKQQVFSSAATTLRPDFVSLPLVPGDIEGHGA